MKPGKIIECEIDFILAILDGKKVERWDRPHRIWVPSDKDRNNSITNLVHTYKTESHRYAPEPEIIPYGPEDVKILRGMEVKSKDGSIPWAMVTGVARQSVTVGGYVRSYSEFLDKYVRQYSGEPCGKVKP